MLPAIHNIFKQRKTLYHLNEGITVCAVRDQEEGIALAKDLLYEIADTKTVLYLSGGKTPKKMYAELATDGKLMPGAVGQVDERYGEPFHANSNQKMMRETELTRYFELRNIPFYPILQGKTREETARAYDEKLRSLNAVFQKSVAILGIGDDGHTAGIPAGISDSRFQISDKDFDLVVEYDDRGGKYGERVTMTFLGLSMMDVLVVLVFGADKKDALEEMFQAGDEADIPARFYKRPEIAPKTIIITDQQA